MATVQLDLTPEFNRFIASKIQSGAYENATQVVEAALAFFEQVDRDDDAKMRALIEAVDAGEASGIVEGEARSVFERIRAARESRLQTAAANA